jgi:cobalamin biosynthesis protein CbiD
MKRDKAKEEFKFLIYKLKRLGVSFRFMETVFNAKTVKELDELKEYTERDHRLNRYEKRLIKEAKKRIKGNDKP